MPITKQRNYIINWLRMGHQYNTTSVDYEISSDEDTCDTDHSETAETKDSRDDDLSTPLSQLNDNGVSKQREQKSKRRAENETSARGTSTPKGGVVLVLAVILIAVVLYQMNQNIKKSIENTNIEKIFERSRKQFPQQHERTWLSFMIGVNTAVNTDQPAVFLLLHDNPVVANCIVSHVSSIVQDIFKLSEEPLQLVAAKEIEMFAMDKTEITRYRSEVEKRIIVVIRDFEEFPGEIAKHFHTFCDVYNPMVQKAVYFFIMKTNDRSTKLNSRARNTMELLWNKSLSDNELDPLITRLSENVIEILSDDVSQC